jgi:hypothetical protein
MDGQERPMTGKKGNDGEIKSRDGGIQKIKGGG